MKTLYGRGKLSGWLIILNVFAASAGWAASIPGLFNTGVDGAGAPIANNASDTHYRLVAGSAVTGPAIVATSARLWPIAPFGPWLGDNMRSAWVTPATSGMGPNETNGTANYRYETKFDLTGLDPATAVIAGHWATDNGGLDVLINGVSTGQANTQQFTDWTYFQINTGFVAGTNTLTFVLNNGAGESPGDGPTGLRVEMSGTVEPRVEPLRLSIRPFDSGHYMLSWPGGLRPTFSLREIVNLPPPRPSETNPPGDGPFCSNWPDCAWAPVTNPVVQVGDRMTVIVEATGGNRFFRLQPILRQRVTFPKPAATLVDASKEDPRQIVLKFQEGTHIRLRSTTLRFDPTSVSPDEAALLARVDLSASQIGEDLRQVKDLLLQDPERRIVRMFQQTEEELARNKAEGEKMSGEELADLDLYFHIDLPEADAQVASDVIATLNGLRSVEIAYARPLSRPACTDLSPTTSIDVTSSQGYLTNAPGGIDARYAWSYLGGHGADVRVIDVEGGWHLNHEDLPGRQFFQRGIFSWLTADVEHGTAVLGELVACDNDFGARGIVIQADYGVSAPTFGIPDAINAAAAALRAGDVILIEQHAKGPGSGLPCDPACQACGDLLLNQFEYVAMENWQADFDAIRTATARGIIVVEAAGNGSMNLDAPQYGGRFNRSVRDSGAILVGGGRSAQSNSAQSSPARSPWCWSNFGSRVDVQGWGDSVGTLGYGPAPSLRANGADPLQWYETAFSGTSSASPIVAGAACSIQGVRRANNLPVLNPFFMRTLLFATGTPQPPSTTNIGPLPNLRNALLASLPQSAVFDSHSVPNCMKEGWIYSVTVTFRNSGRTIWSKADHHLGAGLQRIQLTADVPPGGLATFSFPITVPRQGRYNFQWRMVQGTTWFGDFTPNVPVEVVPDNNAQFVSQNVPSTMDAGQTYPVSITMRNVGASTWTANSAYKLRAEPNGNSTWGISTFVLNQSVPPNDVGAFQFNVTAPAQPGTYNFQWRLLQEGITCFGPGFGDFTPNLSIAVTPPPANDACFLSNSLPTLTRRGDQSHATVTMRNCGTTTWTAGGNYALGSQAPPDNMFWGRSRVPLPRSVQPGESVTFSFDVTANSSSGTFYQWQMVQDGVGFFGEPTPPVLFLLQP
jgi:hypothetical protein